VVLGESGISSQKCSAACTGESELVKPIASAASRPMVLIDVFMMQVLMEKKYFKKLFIPSPRASPMRK